MAEKLMDKIIDEMKENMRYLTALGILFGFLGLLVGTLSLLGSVEDSSFFDSISDVAVVIFLVALITFLLSVVYFVDYTTSQTEFENLMKTDSRATFKRSKERLEELAYKLGRKYEVQYFKAKGRMKL